MASRSNHPRLPPPPQPTRILFDPYNSTSTGHQTAPSRLSGSTSWRQSRSLKLSHQFRDATGAGGSRHVSDLVGAGSENWRKDGRKENGDWQVGAPGLREHGWQDIRALLGNKTRKRRRDDGAATASVSCSMEKEKDREDYHLSASKRRCLDNTRSERRRITVNSLVKAATNEEEAEAETEIEIQAVAALPEIIAAGKNKRRYEYGHEYGRENEHAADRDTDRDEDENKKTSTIDTDQADEASVPPAPQIFRGLNIYLNGSTAPLISDHKLKQLFTRHGGNTSIALGRRTVTHVILGEKAGGGGLASGKIQKENVTVRGKGIKYVSAQWVLDSVEKGIRQPEARYAVKEVMGKLGGSRQRSVRVLFGREEVGG